MDLVKIAKVHVMGLHFCTCHTRKIPSTAKVGRGSRPSLIWLSKELLNSAICKSEKYLILLLNYMAAQLSCHGYSEFSVHYVIACTQEMFSATAISRLKEAKQKLNSNGSIQNCTVSKTPVGRQQHGQKEIAQLFSLINYLI